MGQTESSIYWIEIDKIIPNPYQPRREFDEDRLRELSASIRQYGVLHPNRFTFRRRLMSAARTATHGKSPEKAGARSTRRATSGSAPR